MTLIAGLLGGALLAWGASRRSGLRAAAGASGAALLASALARAEWERRRAVWRTGRAIGVPEDRVFEFWSHYEDARPAPPARRSRRHVVGSA